MKQVENEKTVVVGGGAAGIYGASRAKILAPNLNVIVIEKAKPLAKVKTSGGGCCNVTNGHCVDNMILAEKYPKGIKEFRGSFFNVHGPGDTMSWFADYAVKLKVEEDGRVFPVSDNSSSIINCLLNEARGRRVTLQAGVSVTSASTSLQKNVSELTQVGPMLVTHWGFSGPVILRLSAWGTRDLFTSNYKATLLVDFSPDLNSEDLKSLLSQHKKKFLKQKVAGSYPPELGLIKRFWKYLLNSEGIDEDILWASISNNSLMSIAAVLKQCSFIVKGKGQFKDDFVTAGGVPLSEISLKTMESNSISSVLCWRERLVRWYIAGTSRGNMAATSAPATLKKQAL